MPLTCGRFQSHGKPRSRSSPLDAEFTKEIRACKGLASALLLLARTMIGGSVS